MALEACIYCDQTDAAKFSGREHVIPQAFGKFGSKTPTLGCVCDDCNAAFGKDLDQMLARETLEGVLRYGQGRTSSENRVQRRLRITLADESEAGEFIGAALDGVDPTTNQLMPLATQLRIKNQQTGNTDTFTRAQLATLSLPTEVYGLAGQRELAVFAPSKEEHDAFIAELNEAGLRMHMEGANFGGITPSADGVGTETLGVHIEGTFDQLHRRALAKVFVNFSAFYLGTEVVKSTEWASLRRFVRYEEGELAARISNKPFWTGQETADQRFPDAINIRLENHQRGVVGVIQFYNRVTYELLLIENASLTKEVAARFVDGEEPTFGARKSVN